MAPLDAVAAAPIAPFALRVPRPAAGPWLPAVEAALAADGPAPVRWAIVAAEGDVLVIEGNRAIARAPGTRYPVPGTRYPVPGTRYPEPGTRNPEPGTRCSEPGTRDFTAVQLIPTGVGAAIGGFAGDGGPATKLLAAVVDRLVTHPNAVNGADLLALPANGLYVEGGTLDAWLAGRVALRPVRANRVGLLIDRAVEGMPPGTLEAMLNAAEAVRAVHGVPMAGWALTPRPLGAGLAWGAGGQSTGRIGDPAALLEGARALVAAGAEAIAVAADLGPLDAAQAAAYDDGQAVDPIGGLEAVISRLVAAELGLPCAHAPLWPIDGERPRLVAPLAAAEHLGHTFLPCIALGLARHPRAAAPGEAGPADLAAGAADAVVAPANALGGPGVIAARDRGVPVIAVAANRVHVGVDAGGLGWDAEEGIIPVASYLEAAGVLAAMRVGLDWRACGRPLERLARR